ncbi:hypothetical protein ACH4GZ_23010 [Streptomyces hygroscopicus]|uniref:hypothetical protein n=1 Tax=Streptomyces hygroscopicus TaxID=1912 RepID=UPI0037A05497
MRSAPREDRAAACHLVRLLLTPSMAAGRDGTLDRLLDSFDPGRRVRGIRTGTRPCRANSPW